MYFTAMTLQYLAGDSLDVAVCDGVPRFPAVEARVRREPHPVYLDSTLAGSGQLTDPGDQFRKALVRNNVTFHTTRVGFVEIYDRLTPVVPASKVCG
jgi:hypothetical protein